MTDVQKEAYFQPYSTQWVKWTGKLSDASTTLGQLSMSVKCLPSTLIQDINVELADSEKDALLGINQDQDVSFEAELNTWSNFAGVMAVNGHIIK